MATATVNKTELPPLMQARDGEKGYEFPCTEKHKGHKCERRFQYAQALGRHKSAVHGIAGTAASSIKSRAKKAAKKTTKRRRPVTQARKTEARKVHKRAEPGTGKTSQVIEMTAANHPMIGTTLRVTGLAEDSDNSILMLLKHEDKEWKVVLS